MSSNSPFLLLLLTYYIWWHGIWRFNFVNFCYWTIRLDILMSSSLINLKFYETSLHLPLCKFITPENVSLTLTLNTILDTSQKGFVTIFSRSLPFMPWVPNPCFFFNEFIIHLAKRKWTWPVDLLNQSAPVFMKRKPFKKSFSHLQRESIKQFRHVMAVIKERKDECQFVMCCFQNLQRPAAKNRQGRELKLTICMCMASAIFARRKESRMRKDSKGEIHKGTGFIAMATPPWWKSEKQNIFKKGRK